MPAMLFARGVRLTGTRRPMSASSPIKVSSSSSSASLLVHPPSAPPSPQKYHHDYEERKPSQSQLLQHQSHSHSQSPGTQIPSRPSYAIQEGADAIMDLLESEKLKLTKLYHEAIRHIESSVNNAHAMEGSKLQSAERRVKMQEKSIEMLNTKLRDVKAKAGSTQRELEELRREHEGLKEELGRVGLVWTPPPQASTGDKDLNEAQSGETTTRRTGTLEFTDQTKRIVNDFMSAARMQRRALTSSRLNSKIPSPVVEDDRLSRPVGPAEFFDVLGGVMDQGRKFAAELEKQRRRERAAAQAQLAIDNTDLARESPSPLPPLAVEVIPSTVNGHDPTVPLNPTSEPTNPSPSDPSSHPPSKILEIFTYQLNEYTRLTESPSSPNPSKRPAEPPSSPTRPAKLPKMT